MEVNKKIFRIKADDKMSEAEKKAQIAKLEVEFEELGKKIAALSN